MSDGSDTKGSIKAADITDAMLRNFVIHYVGSYWFRLFFLGLRHARNPSLLDELSNDDIRALLVKKPLCRELCEDDD